LPSRLRQSRRIAWRFIVPGILGSNLKVGNERIWLRMAPRQRLRPARIRSKENRCSAPDGPIGIYYDDLATALFQDHDVKPFAFDWRRPIAAEAKRLAAEIAAALDVRETSKQPVRIIAHSMGGLVARACRSLIPKLGTG